MKWKQLHENNLPYTYKIYLNHSLKIVCTNIITLVNLLLAPQCKNSGLYLNPILLKANRDRWCKVGTLQQHEIVRKWNWRTCNGIIALLSSTEGVVAHIVKLKGRPLLPVSFRDTKLLILISTASTQIYWRQQSMKSLRNEVREWLLIFCSDSRRIFNYRTGNIVSSENTDTN